VDQDASFAGVVVVRGTRTFPTSVRPWHGLSQPGRPRPFARGRACVRRQLAGSGQDAPLASPASGVLPLDERNGGWMPCVPSRGVTEDFSTWRFR
jgi:hypothetical protein